MNQGSSSIIPSTESIELLTGALEERSFNRGVVNALLELFMRQSGMQMVQVHQTIRKEQMMVLELSHFSGDMSAEAGDEIEDAVYHCFKQQTPYYFSKEYGLIELPHSLDVQREPALMMSTHVLLPLRVCNTCVGVVTLACEPSHVLQMNIQWIRMLAAVLAQCLSSTLLPNFATLYARPYQRVADDELGKIKEALDLCNGNKTVAAKLLGMTTRQLRYRLEKLAE